MPGPDPKDPSRRQRRNAAGLKVVRDDEDAVEGPEPPDGMLPSTLEQWTDYWASDVARAVEVDSDLPAVRRLFQLYDERERAYQGYRARRIVPGSQGQPVLNPLARLMVQMDAEIRQLEDRLGLTPKARVRLGITFAEAERTLADLAGSIDPYQDGESD